MSELRHGNDILNPAVMINPVDDENITPQNTWSAQKINDLFGKRIQGTAIPQAFIDTLVGTSGTPTEFAEKLKEYMELNTGIYYRMTTSSIREIYWNYGLIPTNSNYFLELHISASPSNFFIRATRQTDSITYIRVIRDGIAQDWQELVTIDELKNNAFLVKTSIESNTDMNNLKEQGCYRSPAEVSITLLNAPTNLGGKAFVLEVFVAPKRILQRITRTTNASECWQRVCSDNIWTEWAQLVTTDAVVNTFKINAPLGSMEILPWTDGTHLRNVDSDDGNEYTDILIKDGIAHLLKLKNGTAILNSELATMDKVAKIEKLTSSEKAKWSDLSSSHQTLLKYLQKDDGTQGIGVYVDGTLYTIIPFAKISI